MANSGGRIDRTEYSPAPEDGLPVSDAKTNPSIRINNTAGILYD
jgi:hypothetical protein